jgi:hypothetical protein
MLYDPYAACYQDHTASDARIGRLRCANRSPATREIPRLTAAASAFAPCLYPLTVPPRTRKRDVGGAGCRLVGRACACRHGQALARYGRGCTAGPSTTALNAAALSAQRPTCRHGHLPTRLALASKRPGTPARRECSRPSLELGPLTSCFLCILLPPLSSSARYHISYFFIVVAAALLVQLEYAISELPQLNMQHRPPLSHQMPGHGQSRIGGPGGVQLMGQGGSSFCDSFMHQRP